MDEEEPRTAETRIMNAETTGGGGKTEDPGVANWINDYSDGGADAVPDDDELSGTQENALGTNQHNDEAVVDDLLEAAYLFPDDVEQIQTFEKIVRFVCGWTSKSQSFQNKFSISTMEIWSDFYPSQRAELSNGNNPEYWLARVDLLMATAELQGNGVA